MVADDMDPFFVSSKAVFKRFLNALGEDSKPTCGTGDWAKQLALYKAAMVEYGEAMEAEIQKCQWQGIHNMYRY